MAKSPKANRLVDMVIGWIACLAFMGAIAACGTTAQSDGGPYAVRIPGGTGDCYAIMDGNGHAIGGNCK